MRRQIFPEPRDVDGNRLMRTWRRITLSMAVWSGLSGCVNLPVEVRAELDCPAGTAVDHFGNESCADSTR
jgi:hypothetical protein